MSDIFIVVTPAFDRTGKHKHERFDAYLRDTGELICTETRQPLLDASRELLARGYDPKDVVSKGSMRAPIGVAAQYNVMGERFVRRKPINHSPAITNVGVIATGNVVANDNR
jgi:hypothetical protein